ncbi:MAG: UvrD-helicase domain-containing protein, partial [Bacteroidales bacterium]|nr:UvrD-helicase domain-containing protein [Bacteroidales bacterium]
MRKMINIVKASAGSGKTFKLAKTYIELLLRSEDRYAYRHILAVTFTNKATGEMKN